jgi:Flp pilus assembly protein TadG
MKLKKRVQQPNLRGRRRFLPGERGTSLLEMALIIPVLSLILVGIIDIGRYVSLSIKVANAARSGAQYGAQSLAAASDTPGITHAAVSDAAITPALQVTPSVLCYCSGSPCSGLCTAPSTEVVYVQVSTTGTFTPLFSYPGLPALTNVNGMAQMRVAQ